MDDRIGLLLDDDLDSLSNEIRVTLSSSDRWFTAVVVVCSFELEHLQVGILSVVNNRSVALLDSSRSPLIIDGIVVPLIVTLQDEEDEPSALSRARESNAFDDVFFY
jgi:hypothetical protein